MSFSIQGSTSSWFPAESRLLGVVRSEHAAGENTSAARVATGATNARCTTLAAPCGIANCAPAGQDSKTADQRWKVIHLQGLSLHLRNHRPMISQSSLEPIRVQAYLVFLKTVTRKIFDSSPRSLAVFHLWGIPPERTRPLRLSSWQIRNGKSCLKMSRQL